MSGKPQRKALAPATATTAMSTNAAVNNALQTGQLQQANTAGSRANANASRDVQVGPGLPLGSDGKVKRIELCDAGERSRLILDTCTANTVFVGSRALKDRNYPMPMLQACSALAREQLKSSSRQLIVQGCHASGVLSVLQWMLDACASSQPAVPAFVIDGKSYQDIVAASRAAVAMKVGLQLLGLSRTCLGMPSDLYLQTWREAVRFRQCMDLANLLLGQLKTYVENKPLSDVQAMWDLAKSLGLFMAFPALYNAFWKHNRISLGWQVLRSFHTTHSLNLAQWYYNNVQTTGGAPEPVALKALGNIAYCLYRKRQGAMIDTLPASANGLKVILRSKVAEHQAKDAQWRTAEHARRTAVRARAEQQRAQDEQQRLQQAPNAIDLSDTAAFPALPAPTR